MINHMAPFDALQEILPQCASQTNAKLQEALKSMASDFKVHHADQSLLTIYVSEQGHHNLRMNGGITVDLIQGSWADDFVPTKSRFPDDNLFKAGNYVLSGFKVNSTISLPALNVGSLDMLECLQKAQEFARIIRAGDSYLNDQLSSHTRQLGVRFLELKDKDPDER